MRSFASVVDIPAHLLPVTPAHFHPSFPRRRESSDFALEQLLMEKQPAVYILASDRMGTLYLGVTSQLTDRTWQHREHVVDGFSKRYDVTRLVWYELHDTMESAILREKRIKKWNRGWKVRLIEEKNLHWNDLWPQIVGLQD